MEWQQIIRNRFVVTLSALVLIVTAWNVYVSFHDAGSVRGRVVDSGGAGVADAEVVLARETVTSVEAIAKTATDADGYFSFENHGQYKLVLTARAGAAESERTVVPLWFRNQDIVIDTPILVRP